jgi:uncharacterized membrane protein
MLSEMAASRGFELVEAASPEGAPAPCVRFEAPGSPFYRADGLTEAQFTSYLDEAEQSIAGAAGKVRAGRTGPGGRPAGSGPTAEYERGHPMRSFMWRHRVGALIGGLSAFLGLAWVAPLTVSWGWGSGFYNAVHSTYRLVCDQIPQRSAELGGLPVCLCWRCTAIYGGSLLFGILYTLSRDHNVGWMQWLTRPVSLVVMLLFGLPLVLDGATHALGLRTGIADAASPDFWLSWQAFSADWWLRILTATLATIGAVKFLCPRLDKLGFAYERLYRARTQAVGSGQWAVRKT